jgi:septum formation protein
MTFSGGNALVLASASPYRKALLDQLRLQYTVCPANIDESQRAHETPVALATRLACEKARAVAPKYPNSLVVGSDQVASCDDRTAFGKPGDHSAAVLQLRAMSGRIVRFHTAVCVLDASTGVERTALVPTEVRFRRLGDEVIEKYLQADLPYDCAGSARIEGLGIALVEYVRSDDPSALLGLPLIALLDLLAAAGVSVL